MSSLKEQYVEEGYVVVKDVLNPEQDIYPLQKAYSALLDALARIYLVEANSEALDRFDEMSLPERFAMSLGASRGTVLHHLDPVLNILCSDFSVAQRPARCADSRNVCSYAPSKSLRRFGSSYRAGDRCVADLPF